MSAFDIAYLKRDLHNAEKRIADLERRISEMERSQRMTQPVQPTWVVPSLPPAEEIRKWLEVTSISGTVPPIV